MKFTSFLPRFLRPSRSPLRVSARLASLEGELFDLRAELDGLKTPLRKLQGKVYRGVALGDTVEAVTEDSPPPVEPVQFSHSKIELYRRAAELRRH